MPKLYLFYTKGKKVLEKAFFKSPFQYVYFDHFFTGFSLHLICAFLNRKKKNKVCKHMVQKPSQFTRQLLHALS